MSAARPDGMKTCGTCRKVKKIDKYNKDKSKPDGLDARCRSCTSKKDKRLYWDDPEKGRAEARALRAKNLDASRAAVSKWHKANPDAVARLGREYNDRLMLRDPILVSQRRRHQKLMTQYGLSLADELFMTARQHNVCKICRKPPRSGTRLCIDHNHTTGRVRSLLCDNCNRALGCVFEQIEILKSMIEYIRKDDRFEAANVK